MIPELSPTPRSKPTPPGVRPPGSAHEHPQDHPARRSRRAGFRVPGRPRVPGGGRGAPPPAHRRAGTDQRDPRRAEPVLEGGAGSRRPRVTGPAGHLRSRAPPGRRAERAALAGERGQPFAIGVALGISQENTPGQNMAAAAPDVERPARGRRAPLGRAAGDARSRRSSASSTSSSASATSPLPSCLMEALLPAPVDPIRADQPATCPGAPLPHAGIDDERPPPADQGFVAPGRFLRSPARTAMPGARLPAARRRDGHPARRAADRRRRR